MRLVQSIGIVRDRTVARYALSPGVHCWRWQPPTFHWLISRRSDSPSLEGLCRAMDISILTCPKCNAMVLSDAAKCHVCDHILDHEKMGDAEIPALPTDEAVADDLETCAECHETYRRGLVRCWNCGAFTRKEIKEAYNRMTADPARYSASDFHQSDEQEAAPEATRRAGPWKVSAINAQEPVAAVLSSDDETAATDDDFSFELADTVQLTDAMERATESEPETYGFAAPAVTEPITGDEGVEPPIPILAVQASRETLTEEAPVIPSLEKTSVVDKQPELTHKEASAGDVLLQIAREEEDDIQRSRKTYSEKLRGGFVVFCPRGCRIRVQERHRGKAGKCPKCEAVFFVPRQRSKPKVVAEEDASPGVATAAAPVEKWRGYLSDLHLHNVIPQKLRIKPDSLLNDFQQVDIVFSEDGLLVLTLVTAAGFLGANLKKKPGIRTTIQEHLKNVGALEGLPAAQSRMISKDALSQLFVAQPAPADVESMFGNIPVFGTGRIAVRLPKVADDPGTQYLSFALSEFRAFAAALDSVCGVSGLGANTEIPMTEAYNKLACHYSESPVGELLAVDYYQKDPQIKLKTVGWRCQGCGLVVSEDSRKKEKIGGLNGKSIASAKCPKCQAKFGSQPLFEVEASAATPAAASAS